MELRGAEAYIERHGRARKRHRWLTGLVAVVVFCTTYALMLPAVTLEQKTLVCGLEEHVHTESCCDLFSELYSDSLSNAMSDGVCDKKEHVHDEKCYIKEPDNENMTDGAPEPQSDTASAVSVNLRAAARSVEPTGAPASTLPVLEVEAVNKWDPNAEVILVYPQKFNTTGNAISTENKIRLATCFPAEANFNAYYALQIEKRDGRYQVVWAGEASADTGVTCQDAYLLLVQKTACPNLLSLVTADGNGDGDSAHFNLLCGNTEEKAAADGRVYGYVTIFPKKYDAIPGTGGSMDAKADDVAVVAGDPAIRFQLFNYDGSINYTDTYAEGGTNTKRALTPYFVFKGTYSGGHSVDQNGTYDADGFPKNHATVERTLKDGYPVLDINRNADGGIKGDAVNLTQEQRSLNYLFGGVKDHAVTAYAPKNTLLQKTDGHYYYASVNNAVDYDTGNNLFRVRNYTERNSMTAKYGAYWDFMPFNYTDGVVNGTINGTSYTGAGKNGLPYNLRVDQVDYWFGMRMDVDFFQPYDGKLGEEAMTFTFAGDDDVWVFVDDVLVLDLGGTHGEVTGTIDFATGEITQQLTWLGATSPSRPTTLKQCFNAAGRAPSGGWKGDTFADYSKHTLSFFYLERGASVANCKIDFNLYTLPDKELSVAKMLRSDDENADKGTMDYLADTMEYRFQVLKADNEGKATENLLAGKGTEYTLIAPGKADQTMTVGKDGWFVLRSGQRAVFSNTMAMFEANEVPKQYVVRELIPSAQGGQYNDVVYTLDATDGATTQDYQTSKEETTDFQGYDSNVLDAAKGNLVVFYNTVSTEVMGTLKVKKAVNGSKPLTGETYWFRILAGPKADDLTALPAKTAYTVTSAEDDTGTTKTTDTNGLFALKEGETLSLRLLTGTYYQVVEVHADGTALDESKDVYKVTYTNQTGQFDTQNKTIEVTATNTCEGGTLALTKRVNNTYDSSGTGGEFTFLLALQNLPTGWAGRSFPVTYTTTVSGGQTHTDGNVTFDTSGKATLRLYHGETAKIDDLPLNMSVQVTEQNTAGYSVSWENGTTTMSGTAQQTVSLDKTTPNVSLTCVNTTGYELPSTGGPGTGVFYGFGGALTLGALALLSMKRHGGRRGDAF